MQKFNEPVQNLRGDTIALAPMLVLLAGTETPASIFLDAAGEIPIAAPHTDRTGVFGFYAPNGRYDVYAIINGIRIGHKLDVLLYDPADAGGGAVSGQAFAALSGAVQALADAAETTGEALDAVEKKLGETVSVFDFMTAAQIADAKSGAPVLDHTAAVQAALDALPYVLEFNGAATFRVGVLQIKGDCEIRGNGCGLLGAALGLFHVGVPLVALSIHGFKRVAWVAGDAVGTTGRQFFWNGNNAAGTTAYGAAVAYPINDLRIYDNALGASKIECFGLATVVRITGNTWKHAAGVSVAPAYLYCERGTTDDNAGPVYIKDNHFDVYPPDGLGKSIIKVGGGITDAQITGNYVRNNNLACLAHVDVFTGAHKMRFTENTLIDAQLHRKQIIGSIGTAPALYQYDYISGNTFEIRAGSLTNTHIYFIGALGTILGNQFKTRNTATLGYCIQFDPSDEDIGFDTSGPVANIVTGNIFDMRASFTGNAAVKIASSTVGTSAPRYMSISGNILLGGSFMVQGGAQTYSSVSGNVWGASAGAIGTSINGGSPNNLMLGNVADSAVPQMTGNTGGNLVTLSIPTLAAVAVPDVSTGDVFNVNSATAITSFTGGYIGKRVTFFNLGSATFQHGTDIKLNGAVNMVFSTFGDSLTLMQTTATRWVEVGRSKN